MIASSVEQDSSAGDAAQSPKSARPMLSWPAPRSPTRPTTSPACMPQSTGPTSSVVTRSNTSRAAPSCRAGRRNTCDGSRPTISRIASSGRRLADPALADDPAVAQDDHAVGDLEHLVEPVRDVDHADAARRAAGASAANSRATSSAGRLAVGSSSTRISASAASARAMATSDFSVRVEALDAQIRVDVGAKRVECSLRRARVAALQSIMPKRRG